MRTATTTAIQTLDEPSRGAQRSNVARLLGVATASLVPAVFWSVVIELGSFWLGMPLAATTVLIIGVAIALFLFAICAPLMLRKPAPPANAQIKKHATSRA